jgi:hypothetical protein
MQRLCLDPDFSPDEAEEKARLISQVGLVQLLGLYSQHNQPNKLESYIHRDKTRVQMPAKMFPHLKLLCLLTIFFIVKYEKITVFSAVDNKGCLL